MSDKDSKKRRDIESEVIDELLDAIDDWDLEAGFDDDDDISDMDSLFDDELELADDATTASAVEGSGASQDEPFSFAGDSEFVVADDLDEPGDARSSSAPLYVPPVDLTPGDEESTRMVDLRADDRYQDLVRSMREHQIGAPTAAPVDDGPAFDEEVTVDLESEFGDDEALTVEMSADAGEEIPMGLGEPDTVLAPGLGEPATVLAAPPRLVDDEAPTALTEISEDAAGAGAALPEDGGVGARSPAETPIAPSAVEGMVEQTAQDLPPTPRPAPVAAEAPGLHDAPTALLTHAAAGEPIPPPDEAGLEVPPAAPPTMPAAAAAPERPGPESAVAMESAPAEDEAHEPRRGLSPAVRSGMAVVHMGEHELPSGLVDLLDGLLPNLEVVLPTSDEAMPSAEELLGRVEALYPIQDLDAPSIVRPEAVADAARAAAESTEDSRASADLLLEAARIHERRLGAADAARELYVLASQLEPALAAAAAGRRRTSGSTLGWEALDAELEAELEHRENDLERREILLDRAELILSNGGDLSKVMDLCRELEALDERSARVAIFRAEVAAIEQDDAELGRQASALAELGGDAKLVAALRTLAARALEVAGEHEAAKAQLEQAVELDGESPAALAALARARRATGELAGAADALLAMTELFGPGAATRALRRRAASMHAARGDLERAAESLGDPGDRAGLALALSLAGEQGDRDARGGLALRLAAETEDPIQRAALALEALTAGAGDAGLLGELLEDAAGSGTVVAVARAELTEGRDDVAGIAPDLDLDADASAVPGFRAALELDRDGKGDESKELLRGLMGSARAGVEAALALATLGAATKDWEALVEGFDKLATGVGAGPWSRALDVQLGRAREHRLDDRDGARDHYLRAVDGDGALYPALTGALRTSPDSASRIAAARALAEASTDRLGAVSRFVSAAAVAEAAGDVEAALSAYDAALASEPTAISALFGAARLLEGEGRGEDAMALWRQAANATSGGVAAYGRAVVAARLAMAGDLHGAGDLFGSALDAWPDDPSVAAALVTASRSPTFAERLELVADRLPSSRRVAALLSSAEMRLDDDPEGALRCVRAVLERTPERADAAALQDDLLVRAGLDDELWAALEARLEVAPDAPARVDLMEQMAWLAAYRGDIDAEMDLHQSIRKLDPSRPTSLHWLAARLLSDQRWEELADVQVALAETSTDDDDAVAHYAMASRLFEVTGARGVSALELARKAHARRPELLRTLHGLYFAARDEGAWGDVVIGASGLAKVLGEPRCRAVFELRAAEVLENLERYDEAREALRRAAGGDPPHPLASWRLSHLAEELGDDLEAATEAVRAAELSNDKAHRTAEYLRAARIFLERLDDKKRALDALRGAIEADPACEEAHAMARDVLDDAADPRLSLDLIVSRLAGDRDPDEVVELGLRGAKIAFELGQRARGKSLLRQVLAADARNVDAMRRLEEACVEDGEWAEAAQVLVKLTRVVEDPLEARDLFYRLGIIYQEHLPDVRRAIGSFQKVLSYEPHHLEALRRLSSILVEAREWKAAAEVTLRLSKSEPDESRRREALMTLSKVYEDGLKDTWRAEQALDEARRLDPTDIDVVEAFAAFCARQSASNALKIHLDRAATDFRRLLEEDATNLDAYHSLFRVFRLGRRDDEARLVVDLLDTFGAARREEADFVAQRGGAAWVPSPAVADIRLDDDIGPPMVTRSLRNLFAMIGEPLAKMGGVDLRHLGLGRGQRQGRGNPVFEVGQTLAQWFGLGSVEVYVHGTQPNILMPLQHPQAVVLGKNLIDGASEAELRFYFGRALALIQRRLTLLVQYDERRLAVLVPAIVRALYPSYEFERAYDEALLNEVAREVGRAIPRKLRASAGPLALECVGEDYGGPEVLVGQVRELADRVGLLASGGLMPTLRALWRLAGLPANPSTPEIALEQSSAEPRCAAALRFFVSQAHVAARARLGLSVPV